MSYTDAVKNAAVDAMAAMGDWISLHTGDPSNTGASEDTSVGREQTTWGSSAGGVATGTQVALDADDVHYTHYGVWSASTAGTFRWGFPLDPGFEYDAPATAYVTPKLTFPT